MGMEDWNNLNAERRRVLLRQYQIPLIEAEQYCQVEWLDLPRWMRDDLEGWYNT
jgi:hypothetical protein